RLKMARPNAGCSYRGDIPNMSLALRYEPRLKGCFAWNAFRHRVEVTRTTPWCLPEWWEAAERTPVGYRALRDTDSAELGNYLVQTYDFGDATGDRRYWIVSVIRALIAIEALRRDRDQLLAEALTRLEAGEQHWPTPEEEERLIVPEQQKFVPEAAAEIVAILQR